MLFVFGITPVANPETRLKTPIWLNPYVGVAYAYKGSRGDTINFAIRREMSLRIHDEITRDVLVIQIELIARQNHRVQIGAPDYFLARRVIIQTTNPDIVPCKNQCLFTRTPNSKRPITDKLAKASCPPSVESCCNYSDIASIGECFLFQLSF